MRQWYLAGAATVGLALPMWASAAEAERSKELAAPARIEAEGKPINICGYGHSAPFVGDIDGDGKVDLLVGTFKDGLLRVYKNTGTNKQPKFDKFDLFLADGAEGKVPTG